MREGGLDASVATNGLKLFFAADDGTHGQELWSTDGTTIGTALLADIVAGSNGSSVAQLINVPSLSSAAVFTATTAAHGNELWFWNGATAAEIKDIYAGASSSSPRDLVFLTSPSVRVIFSADDGSHGREPWVSTGSAGGTVLIKDILTGAQGSEPYGFTSVDGSKVIFGACAQASSTDCEPYTSDGTAGNATLIKDIESGTGSSSPLAFQPLAGSGQVYFIGPGVNYYYTPRIYRTDLTAGGTVVLTEQGAGQFSPEMLSPFFYPYQPAGGEATLLFPFSSLAAGFELFKIAADECPSDDSKTSVGLCGCGVADADADGDGAVDCLETCPSDPGKSAPGVCGCGTADVDTQGNGVFDCVDALLPGITPGKPRITVKGTKVTVSLTAREGVVYVIETRLVRAGKKAGKFKLRTITQRSFKVSRPKHGYTLQVRYRYQVAGDTSLKSKLSRAVGKRF